jgi:carboxymethylenebutenolidase
MHQLWRVLFVLGLTLLLATCSDSPEEEFLDRMDREHEGDAPVENAAQNLKQSAEVSGKEVQYATVGGQEISGYLAKSEGAADRPGIIVIHEWWGLNDNIRMMADKLAGEGYTALAVDLYNGKVAESPDSAGTYARSVNDEEALDNLTQAYTYLNEKQAAENIGVIGWCFGGAWSLNTALAHPQKIDATVIYYGRLVTDTEKLKTLEMPVLGIFGEEDGGIPPQKVKEFESALNEVGVENSIHIYEGAGHAFANPSGTRYVEKAAEDAWQKTVRFLEQNLNAE